MIRMVRQNRRIAMKVSFGRVMLLQRLRKIETGKFVLHQPFNRQIKKMKQDGLPMAPATVDDWHQATCEMLEPLLNYKGKGLF